MHTSTHKDCGCGDMKTIIKDAYNVKGENFLSPTNKTIADGFWTAGQSNKLTEGFLSVDKPKKGGKK